MTLEIEAKFRLADPPAMRQRILAAGGKPAGSVLEDNTYFDTRRRTLLKGDRGLRMRRAQPMRHNRPAGEPSIILTYKGPHRAVELKVRQEEEVRVNSVENALALFDGLGFRPVLSFQKRRETFHLQTAEICLDELPELGWFMEIEAPDEAAVEKVRGVLGLAHETIVATSYTALVDNYLSRHRPGERELSF